MFKDRRTYSEFLRAEEGIATNILADRLTRLEQDGIIAKDDTPNGGGYRLTPKGIDLLPIMMEIIGWSAKHDSRTAADREFVRRLRADKDLKLGGWFKERVADWRPNEALSFELYECTLPVRRLRHDYTLMREGGATVVRQRMEYELKFGPLGKLLDAVMVRRKWNAGIKGFLSGLKRYAEVDQPSVHAA